MDVRPVKWLLYLALSWRFLHASCQTTGTGTGSLPVVLSTNLTACQTYNIDVSGLQGTLPFAIAISTNIIGVNQLQQEEWSMNGIEAAANFPIFFFPGTTVALSVTDSQDIPVYSATLQVSGDALNAACASSSNVTSTALSSSIAATGPCDPTNLQWESQDTDGFLPVITIETLNLVQNINHTISYANGNGVLTQIRMPPGVEYRVLVSTDSISANGSEEVVYAASGPLVVQNMTNTTCLANNYNPPIDNTVSITNSTTASLPTIASTSTSTPSSTPSPHSNNLALILGLSISLSLVSLLCIYLYVIYRRERNRPKRDLPSSISGMGLVTQLANLNPMRREETHDRDQYEDEYRDELSRGDYVAVTAHDDQQN